MKIFNIRTLLILIAASALFFASCSEDDTVATGDPSITSLSSHIGEVGDEITILGTDFGDENDPGYVSINGQIAPDADYKEWTDTRIRMTIPSGANATGVLFVNNDGVNSNSVDFFIGPMKPEPPTNLMATSKDATSIILDWDKAPADEAGWSVFKDYVLYAEDSQGNDLTPMIVLPMNKPYTVTGLTEGEVYTFMLYSRYTNDNESEDYAEVKWSPATRFTETANEVEIKVYESASDFGSGLDLYNPVDEGPLTLTVGAGMDWNLGLDTRNDGLVFGSASEIDYNYTGTPQSAEISTTFFFAASLDEVFEKTSLLEGDYDGTYGELAIDLEGLPGDDGSGNVVFIVRVWDGNAAVYNYAKVMLKRVGGEFLQGDSPNRYIEMVVSYQKVEDVPYAKFPLGG